MEATVLDHLRDVLDPETGVSLLSLGVVRSVRVTAPNVEIVLDGGHALARHFAAEAEAAVRDAVPPSWAIDVRFATRDASG